MTWQELDLIFPFVVFFYGIVLVFVLENRTLSDLLDKKMPFYAQQFRSHKSIAWMSFVVGGLWSLQNLVLMP
ncbi:MAG: hypothetical protein ACK5RO_12725 [Pseudobdellovibrionaceae bacterium]|jgi:hypothetical protein